MEYINKLATFGIDATQSLYQNISRKQDKSNVSYFLEKHYPDQTSQLLLELYPNGKEVFLVRDFRDMVASMLSFNARRGTVEFGRANASSNEEFIYNLGKTNVSNLYHAWKSRSKNAHLVRYEDMILNPLASLKSIFKYLAVDYSENYVETIVNNLSKNNDNSNIHMTSKNAVTSTGRWKTDLNKSEKKACQRAFGSMLEEFGYDADI